MILRLRYRPHCAAIHTQPLPLPKNLENTWIFEPLPEGKVVVRILEFREMWGGRPDEEGEVIFHAQCRLRTLAGALLSELQKLERTYGLVGYRQKWVEHDFPIGRLDELRELLDDSPDRDVT